MIAMSMFVLSVSCGALVAEVPEVVTVSAYLESGGAPVDEVVSARFTFFDAAEGGSPVWSETQAALVDGGVLVAELGGRAENPITPEMFAGARWLEIALNDEVLEPRARAASVPAALAAARAEVCESLGGITSEDIGVIAATAAAPITRGRIAGVEVPLYAQATGCDLLASSTLTLRASCTTTACSLGSTFAHNRCDGSCGAPSPLQCDNPLVGWLLPP